MIRINLLPFRATRRKENIRRQVSIFFLSLNLVLIVMGIVGTRMETQIREEQEVLTQKKKEATALETQAKEVDVIREEFELLEKKLNVLAFLEKGRRLPVDIFEALTEAVVPQRMCLLSYKADVDRVQMSGLSLDDITVADFMMNLEKSGFFSFVSLESVRQNIQGKVSLRAFSLVCQRKKDA